MDSAVNKAKEIIAQYSLTHPIANDLESVIKGEDIRVSEKCLDEEPALSGMLVYRGDKKGIIINTFIANKGRHNFTLAHELGHYFLKHTPKAMDGTGFRCSNEDIYTGYNPIEAEANKFAVELLMPENPFRLMITGAPLDFTLISNMASEFKVSKHASSFRILDFVKSPHAVILTTGYNITAKKQTGTTKQYQIAINALPERSLAHKVITKQLFQFEFEQCDPRLWFSHPNEGINLYSCTRFHKESNTAMTILRW